MIDYEKTHRFIAVINKLKLIGNFFHVVGENRVRWCEYFQGINCNFYINGVRVAAANNISYSSPFSIDSISSYFEVKKI